MKCATFSDLLRDEIQVREWAKKFRDRSVTHKFSRRSVQLFLKNGIAGHGEGKHGRRKPSGSARERAPVEVNPVRKPGALSDGCCVRVRACSHPEQLVASSCLPPVFIASTRDSGFQEIKSHNSPCNASLDSHVNCPANADEEYKHRRICQGLLPIRMHEAKRHHVQ